jgi:hypothetical protein
MTKSAVSRRCFCRTTSALALAAPQTRPPVTYDSAIEGIRVLPGQWRPHYRWEHIAWVSPPWPSQDYIWLDFPEAIFTSQGLIFLSHINPQVPTVYNDLPRVPWRETTGGIAFERELPNGVRFGGSVARDSAATVALELHIMNGTKVPLKNITLQTCAFLRAIREFADFTNQNKYVHLPKSGWIAVSNKMPPDESGPYRLGWRRSGVPVADLPVMVTTSNRAGRLVAMTWHKDTLSMVANPMHPCFHADPQFRDLEPGEAASIRGHLIFFAGKLDQFDFSKQVPAAADSR